MGYRAGVYGLEEHGIECGPAHVYCDKCGIKRGIYTRWGMPYKWLLKGWKAPGWSGGKHPDNEHLRIDYCPECTTDIIEGKAI